MVKVSDDCHVENVKSPRGYFLFSTWTRKKSSEVSFDSSEVPFLAYVENFLFSRGDFGFPTWGLTERVDQRDIRANSYFEVLGEKPHAKN
ncbi:hypothetical protein [Porphyromonas asaccharolytica]